MQARQRAAPHWRAPPGRFIDIPGRGTHFFRRRPNPDKPALLLLHGMLASGGLNWFRAFDRLAQHFDVIAPICAVMAEASARWLCGSGHRDPDQRDLAHLPRRLIARWVLDLPETERTSESRWALDELRRNSIRVVLESARDVAFHDAGDWLADIDVPTAVLITARDRTIPAAHQLEMARRIAGAEIFRHDGGHMSCGKPEFGVLLTQVCFSVASRVEPGLPSEQFTRGIPLPRLPGADNA